MFKPVFDDLARSARELARLDDPVDAECWISELLAMYHGMPLVGEPDAQVALGQGLVRGPEAVERLEGAAAFTSGWRAADVFGDQTLVVLGFAHDGWPEHSLLDLVDHNLGGVGLIKDAYVGPPPAEAADAWAQQGHSEGEMLPPEPITASGAAALLRAAVERTEMTLDPPVTDGYRDTLALLRARLTALPAGEAEVPEWTDQRRDELMQSFAASCRARGEELDDVDGFNASLLVDFRCDYGDGQPLRWSPTLVEICLLGWVPRKVTADREDLERLPGLLDAWVRFAAERTGLPASALHETRQAIRQLRKPYVAAIDDEEMWGPAKQIAMRLQADDIDITDQAALDAWLAEYNARLTDARR